jgi:hypothetical protein
MLAPKRQNLFLFYEKIDDDKTRIDCKLVDLFMNRCVIEEDAQFEVLGAYQLPKKSWMMAYPYNPRYKEFAAKRHTKQADDRDIFAKATDKASQYDTALYDTHFVIGSYFYSLRNKFMSGRYGKFHQLISRERNKTGLKSLYVTLLTGSRFNIIPKETSVLYYEGKLMIRMQTIGGKDLDLKPQSSINDDLEILYGLLKLGGRLERTYALFLHQLLTPKEMKMLKNKNEDFLKTFKNYVVNKSDPDISKEELRRLQIDESESKLRYAHSICWRTSFHLK